MAVVINDFEVINEAPPSGAGAAAQGGESQQGGAPAAPTPNDLRRALRREMERVERVRAD